MRGRWQARWEADEVEEEATQPTPASLFIAKLAYYPRCRRLESSGWPTLGLLYLQLGGHGWLGARLHLEGAASTVPKANHEQDDCFHSLRLSSGSLICQRVLQRLSAARSLLCPSLLHRSRHQRYIVLLTAAAAAFHLQTFILANFPGLCLWHDRPQGSAPLAGLPYRAAP